MRKIVAILNLNIRFDEILKLICLELYDEHVDVYQEIFSNSILYEIHFEDDKYYELEYKISYSKFELCKEIERKLIFERLQDIKNVNSNSNNIRHYKKL